jgi:hypothetical protein
MTIHKDRISGLSIAAADGSHAQDIACTVFCNTRLNEHGLPAGDFESLKPRLDHIGTEGGETSRSPRTGVKSGMSARFWMFVATRQNTATI